MSPTTEEPETWCEACAGDGPAEGFPVPGVSERLCAACRDRYILEAAEEWLGDFARKSD